MEGTAIVMFDPDNGIGRETKMYRRDGTKYAYLTELRLFWERNQSLVVYHHMSQGRTARAQTLDIGGWLEREFQVEVIPLLFSRGTARVFFVVPQPDANGVVIGDRVDRMLATGWRHHFAKVREE